ncbi:MAG: IS4/IS5 family transposase, partial [Cyanobacteria bacterium P01_D01_bin.50]
KYQKEFGKTGKTRVDQSKLPFLDFSKNAVSRCVQRKYRRLVVRWERQSIYFNSLIDLATIHIWIHQILLVG